MCLAVCNGSAKCGGWDYSSDRDLCTYYTLYCMSVLTSGRTRGAAAEDVIVEEQYLKRTQFGLTM